MYRDIETDEIITTEQLKNEWKELTESGNIEPMTFSEYIMECIGKNGTLEEL